MEAYWVGYIELIDGGVVHLETYLDGIHSYAYVNGELADDVGNLDELRWNYGGKFYKSLADYKIDVTVRPEEIWPNVV